MSFIGHTDISTYLIHFFLPKDLIRFSQVSKEIRVLVLSCSIYVELLRLKFDKKLYLFGSHDIIKSYYEHGMVNLITQHRFDHYRAVVIAAEHGHLDLLKLIYQSNHHPIAKYNFSRQKIIRDAIIAASKHHHYHILKWFAHIGIINHWLMPSKIYHKPIHSSQQERILVDAIRDASATGNLPLLQDLDAANVDWELCWYHILRIASEHGQLLILQYLSDQILPKLYLNNHHRWWHWRCGVILPGEPNSDVIMSIIKWYKQHKQNSVSKLYPNFTLVCKHGRIDILEKYFPSVHLNEYDDLLHSVVLGGSIDAVTWLYHKDEKKFMDNLRNIVYWSFNACHLPLLAWLTTNFPTIPYIEYLHNFAIYSADLNLLTWLWEKGVTLTITKHCIVSAASYGYIHILAWLEDHQLLPPNTIELIIETAVEFDHIQIVRWVGVERIKKWTNIIPRLVRLAIINNAVEILDLFHQHQMITYDSLHGLSSCYYYDDNQFTTDLYVMLRWIKERYAQFDIVSFLCHAIEQNEWHIVDWIIEKQPDISAAKLTDKLKKKLLAYRQYQQIKN